LKLAFVGCQSVGLFMIITQITADRRQEWNAFVAQEPAFALLQSWEWGEFKEKLGWKAFRIVAAEQGRILAGVQLLIRPFLAGLVSMAYVPRGPVGEWLDEKITTPLLNELHRVARSYRAVFLRIEPPLPNDSVRAQILQQHNFKSSPYTNQPRATITMDLMSSLDEMLANMHQKTRYNIRYAAKKGVTVRIGGVEDLPVFYHLIKITGQRGGFNTRTLDYYLKEWETFSKLEQIRLFIASYQGEPIAANMSAVFGKHAAYLHGASSGEYSNLQPNYLLMWEALQWAKTQNCRTFDFWGIPDEAGLAAVAGKGLPATDSTDGLWGVYRFKSGFSKNTLLYMGAHDYAYLAPLYGLITTGYTNAGVLDLFAALMDSFRHG
jgi:lipid II:glycine glycyltransferase (peptidoglycan interpeptide bridge formation enzyme)